MADDEKPEEVVSAPKDSADIVETPTDAKEKVTIKPNSEDVTEGTLSKLEADIIRRLEFYFGDDNLKRDEFMKQFSKNEGWVPLCYLFAAKRMTCADTEVVVNALMKSDEGLIEISEDKQMLRRHPERPIPEQDEEHRNEIMSRTAYAKGFPLDIDMSDLIDFFNPYVKVVNISMRKYFDKARQTYKFKGSVFVTFEKKEQTQEFIEKEKVVYKERELVRKWQKVYLEEKREEMMAKSKMDKAAVEEEKLQLPKLTTENISVGLKLISAPDTQYL